MMSASALREAVGATGASDDIDFGSPASDPWEPPTPFFEANLPTFPVDALSEWQRDFASDESVATQTPIDLPAMLTLGATAAAVAKTCEAEVRDGWREPLNAYVIVAMKPGERKSANFADVTRPMFEYECAAAEEIAPAISEARARRAVLEKEIAHRQAVAAKERDNAEHEIQVREIVKLQQQLDAFTVPTEPRLAVDDCTPERLATLLRENGGRMAVLSAEAEIFELMSGKYQSGAQSLNLILKAHSGDDLRVDRVGRPPDHIRKPALTLGLTTQPDVIRGLTARPGFRGKGMLARLWYSLPASAVGQRAADAPPVRYRVRQRYERAMARLLALSPSDNPPALRFTHEAVCLINDFAETLEPAMGEYGTFGFMADWCAKLTGAMVRVAGLLHVADNAEEDAAPWETLIEAATVNRAREIASYLLLHAQAAMAQMGADNVIADAMHLLGWIRRSGVESFTVRELHRGVASGDRFRAVGDLAAPLSLLVERGYARKRLMLASRVGGRPPSPTYDVNPVIHAGNER